MKNEPAFPHLISAKIDKDTLDMSIQIDTGMSLRDYFAAKAMQGIHANVECNERTFTEIAEISYKQADAMLKAREE